MIHPIHYIAIYDPSSPGILPALPPDSFVSPILLNIGEYPFSLEHIIMGCDYYINTLSNNVVAGYQLDFVNVETIEDNNGSFILPDTINIIILSIDSNYIQKAVIELSRVITKDCYILVEKDIHHLVPLPRTFVDKNELWKVLYERAYSVLSTHTDYPSFCVPLFAKDLVPQKEFLPANVNSMTLNRIAGNWNANFGNLPPIGAEEGHSERQEYLSSLINKFSAIELLSHEQLGKPMVTFRDQFRAPLILAMPFSSVDARKNNFQQIHYSKDEKSYIKALQYVQGLEQNTNYVQNVEEGCPIKDPKIISFLLCELYKKRSLFLDFVGQLHASFRFSPYIRLPFIGKSINQELSYVSSKSGTALMVRNNVSEIINTISAIGSTIAKHTMVPCLQETIKDSERQIVAITDLPIEWTIIDGVPLGFSHDICRIPETPYGASLSHYGISRLYRLLRIPKNITQRTLVVFGTEDVAFKHYQDIAEQVYTRKFGIRTARCQSINDLEVAVRQHNPFLLIIDTHGGTDLKNHQSFIWIGKDQVYPQDIVNKKISAPLVWLSACTTAPVYNDINSLANGFCEAGAHAVTSAYMPLDIEDSSILYLRVIHQLSQAATQKIHKNWLAFVSHILRSSYITQPLAKQKDPKQEVTIESAKQDGKPAARSMYFQYRREVFKDLQEGKPIDGYSNDYSKILPHYLLYTTIGRADLIEFESFYS